MLKRCRFYYDEIHFSIKKSFLKFACGLLVIETLDGIWTCLSCSLDSRCAVARRLVILCVFCVALCPAASGRRKVWIYLPGPVCWGMSEHEFSQTIIAMSCYKISVRRSQETSLVCDEFIITLLHFSCAGWKDFNSCFSLAQNQ